MEHNKLTIQEKLVALESKPKEFESRLFFSGRNNAIEALCLRIENKFLRQGFNVEVDWKESSFYPPVISIVLVNPKPTPTGWEAVESSVYLDRETISVFDRDNISSCFYKYIKTSVSSYTGTRTPKLVTSYAKYLQSLADENFFEDEINKVNYPFYYNSKSSY